MKLVATQGFNALSGRLLLGESAFSLNAPIAALELN